MSLGSSSNSSLHPPPQECHNLTVCTSILKSIFFSYIVLLPLFIFVLYVGYQRWRKQRSVAMAATTSHSDIFTFNMVVLEMIGVLALGLSCYGTYSVKAAGEKIFTIVSPGETLFHLLTCVERYLAVVHPVTYLGLRQAGGVRIRNISVGCVWLLSFGSPGLMEISNHSNVIFHFVFSGFSSIFVSFCSLSVLSVLIRPGPGKGGGNGKQVDQSKQKAFHTMMAVMGALLLRFLGRLVYTSVYSVNDLIDCSLCLLSSAAWISLPSSLVLPLLFLHRAGKTTSLQTHTHSVRLKININEM